MERFRVHHILCTALYEGHGYSGDFCENMTNVTKRLDSDKDMELMLVTSRDVICKRCPNYNEDTGCSQDMNHVTVKDELLLRVLGLTEEKIYSYDELIRCAYEKITKEEFVKSCSNCTWYSANICSYEKLRNNLCEKIKCKKILNKN